MSVYWTVLMTFGKSFSFLICFSFYERKTKSAFRAIFFFDCSNTHMLFVFYDGLQEKISYELGDLRVFENVFATFLSSPAAIVILFTWNNIICKRRFYYFPEVFGIANFFHIKVIKVISLTFLEEGTHKFVCYLCLCLFCPFFQNIFLNLLWFRKFFVYKRRLIISQKLFSRKHIYQISYDINEWNYQKQWLPKNVINKKIVITLVNGFRLQSL